jgi:glutathione S-transferase
MSELIFYTNPQSRGQIVRWALEEIAAPYETRVLDYAGAMKSPDYLAINPMGKVPAIRHDGKVVTEVAAIVAYLADAFSEAGLAPPPAHRADYYRWMFFASGPIEQAFSNKAAGFEPTPERQRMFGYGNFDLTVETAAGALADRPFVAGDSFTAADIVFGSQINFLTMFGMLEPRAPFTDYVARITDRDAYRRAQALDKEAAEAAAAKTG